MNWNDPAQAHREYKRLDAKFGTTPDSPLHHDNRCPCANMTFEVVAEIEVSV